MSLRSILSLSAPAADIVCGVWAPAGYCCVLPPGFIFMCGFGFGGCDFVSIKEDFFEILVMATRQGRGGGQLDCHAR